MRTIVYVVQVIIGGMIGMILGRGASAAIGAASSPSCWRGCCAVAAVVVVGLGVFGAVAATQGW